MIGNIQFRAKSNAETPIFKAAVITLNEDAVDAGAFPDLFLDAADFLWTNQEVCDERGTNQSPSLLWRNWPVDIRVRRLLRQSERDVVVLFENGNPTGQIEFAFFFRTLLWVP